MMMKRLALVLTAGCTQPQTWSEARIDAALISALASEPPTGQLLHDDSPRTDPIEPLTDRYFRTYLRTASIVVDLEGLRDVSTSSDSLRLDYGAFALTLYEDPSEWTVPSTGARLGADAFETLRLPETQLVRRYRAAVKQWETKAIPELGKDRLTFARNVLRAEPPKRKTPFHAYVCARLRAVRETWGVDEIVWAGPVLGYTTDDGAHLFGPDGFAGIVDGPANEQQRALIGNIRPYAKSGATRASLTKLAGEDVRGKLARLGLENLSAPR